MDIPLTIERAQEQLNELVGTDMSKKRPHKRSNHDSWRLVWTENGKKRFQSISVKEDVTPHIERYERWRKHKKLSTYLAKVEALTESILSEVSV